MNKSQVQRLRVLFGQLSARKEEVTVNAQMRAIEMLPESEQDSIMRLFARDTAAESVPEGATEPELEALEHWRQLLEGDEFKLEREVVATAELALRAIGVLYGQR